MAFHELVRVRSVKHVERLPVGQATVAFLVVLIVAIPCDLESGHTVGVTTQVCRQ